MTAVAKELVTILGELPEDKAGVGIDFARFLQQQAGASKWAPTASHPTSPTGQFNIADDRSPEQVAKLIQSLGYEPVWKDWDVALTT